jgi:hypothetical protein
VCRCVQADVEGGRGFALLRNFPCDGNEDDVARMLWGLGTHLGAADPQDARGSLLHHVRS